MRQLLQVLCISIILTVSAFGQSGDQKITNAADEFGSRIMNVNLSMSDTLSGLQSGTADTLSDTTRSGSLVAPLCLSEMPVLQPDSVLTESMPVLTPPPVDDEMFLLYKRKPGKCMAGDPGPVVRKGHK